MSWFTDTFGSTLGRKLLVSLTGLFLISFLIVHLAGNLQLLKGGDGQDFNDYAYFMTHNPVIKTMSYLLYTGILLHAALGLALAYKNKKARPVGYKMSKANANSHWTSRSMAMMGTLILAFILLHMKNFWYEYKFGTPESGEEIVNLYNVVAASYQEWWIVGAYVFAMLIVSFHLYHGFASAFQTLGLNHKKYTPVIKTIGVLFAILVPAAFAVIPVYMKLFIL